MDEVHPMFPVKWYAAHLAQEPLTPFSFERPDPGRQDVRVEILFCGICHSQPDVALNEWGRKVFPY